MAIIADVTLPRSAPIPNVYISPFRVAETPSGGEYELTYRKDGKDGPEFGHIPLDLRYITFLGGSPRFKKGVSFDRLKPNREQVYDDIRAKLLGGEFNWLSNIRNDDGSPFMEAPGKSEADSAEDEPIDAAVLDAATDEALDNDPGDLFPDAPAPAPDPLDVARAINATLLHKDDDLPAPGAPLSDWEGEVGALVSNVPPEIAELLDEGETLTRDVRRKLTERLNVELAELKNLRGLAGEDLKREAEIEKLLGLFARLGEI